MFLPSLSQHPVCVSSTKQIRLKELIIPKHLRVHLHISPVCEKNVKFLASLKKRSPATDASQSQRQLLMLRVPTKREEYYKYKPPSFTQWASSVPAWKAGLLTLPRAVLAQLGERQGDALLHTFCFRRIPSGVPSWHISPMGDITTSMEQIIIDPPVMPSSH
jgi:hypothetical protein